MPTALQRKKRVRQFDARCFLVLILATLAVPALSQPQTRDVPIERKHFRQVLEYYAAPHDNQIKTMLIGARARIEPGGKILMNDIRVEMFDEKGALNATAEAPECTFYSDTRFLCSTGHVKVVRLELQDSIEGDGFSYQQTNSLMFISNNVVTLAHNVQKPH